MPISLFSASPPYTAVTEFDYVAQSIISLWYTICLFLNKLHNLTGRSGLGMQAVSVSITALLFHAATWLPGPYPFSGRNSLLFVSVIVSLSYLDLPLYSFWHPFSLHFYRTLFIKSCRDEEILRWLQHMHRRRAFKSMCAGGGKGYVECFKDWKVRMVNCLSVHESH